MADTPDCRTSWSHQLFVLQFVKVDVFVVLHKYYFFDSIYIKSDANPLNSDIFGWE